MACSLSRWKYQGMNSNKIKSNNYYKVIKVQKIYKLYEKLGNQRVKTKQKRKHQGWLVAEEGELSFRSYKKNKKKSRRNRLCYLGQERETE